MYTFPLLYCFPDRIDLPCPKGWWGNPVCGPCHCAVSKGFDPDCNKTNGQCQCKVSPARGQTPAASPSPLQVAMLRDGRVHAHVHTHAHTRALRS